MILKYVVSRYHLKTFHTAATVHYIRSSQLFHTNLCRAPALFLLSASDPVGAERSNRSVYDSWCKMGVKVCYFFIFLLWHVKFCVSSKTVQCSCLTSLVKL